MLRFAPLFLLFLSLSGPAGGEETTAPSQKPNPAQRQPIVLKIGMDAAQVRGAIGQPHEVKPLEAEGINAEIWVYRRLISRETVQEVTGTWNRPYFDIVANTMKHVPEPVYSTAIRRVEEVTHLLLVEGRLAEWKRFNEESKTYE